MSAEAEESAAIIKKEKDDAKEVEDKVLKEKEEVEAQQRDVAKIQAEAKAELDVAMPALKKALKNVDALDKSAITEIKSMNNPPEAVKVVLEGVCIMFGEKTEWVNAKKVISDMKFLEKVKGYDMDNITPKYKISLQKLLKENPDIVEEKVKDKSLAASALCGWLHAMIMYSEVKIKVAPLEEKVAKLNAELAAANKLLNEKLRMLKEVQDKVAKLEAEFNALIAKKKELADSFETCNVRLTNSEKLNDCLGAE